METVEHTASQTETACLHRMDMWLQFSSSPWLLFHLYTSGLCKCASAIVSVDLVVFGWGGSVLLWVFPGCAARAGRGRTQWVFVFTSSAALTCPHQLTYALWFIQAVSYQPIHNRRTQQTFFFLKQNFQIKSETGKTCLLPTLVNNHIFVELF